MRGAAQIADLDVERLRGSDGGNEAESEKKNECWEPDHGSIPINGAPTFPRFCILAN
jgi:hypothetical protein